MEEIEKMKKMREQPKETEEQRIKAAVAASLKKAAENSKPKPFDFFKFGMLA